MSDRAAFLGCLGLVLAAVISGVFLLIANRIIVVGGNTGPMTPSVVSHVETPVLFSPTEDISKRPVQPTNTLPPQSAPSIPTVSILPPVDEQTATPLVDAPPSAMTREDVIALLIPNEEDRSITTAELTQDKIGWIVETKTQTGRKNADGIYVDGKRIVFHYPGRGAFDYWSKEPKADPPCKSILITTETQRLTCPRAMDIENPKLDGVTWYP